MLLLLLNYVVLRALWKKDVHLISTLVNKSLYYYIILYYIILYYIILYYIILYYIINLFQFIGYIEKGMDKGLEDYDGISGNTASSLGWNWIMQEVRHNASRLHSLASFIPVTLHHMSLVYS